jgi:hypothetical protein
MKEALKMALEALECALSDDKPYIVKSKEAITAIEAALAAQPAHVISEKEQLKQWIATTNYYRAKREYEPDAAQPAQEPWVGLTDEDKETLILKHAPPLHPDYKDDSLHGLLQAANDFLRELNT